jgi:hypothetical protein
MCAAYAQRMGSELFFCNVTAAHLLGLRYPLTALDRTVHVGTRKPGRAPRGSGVSGHQLSSATLITTLDSGLRVSTAIDTWCQLSPTIHLGALIEIGDGLVCRQDPPATIEQLRRAVDGWRNRPGCVALRAALPEIRPRTDSARETRLRLMIVQAGFPEPEANFMALDPSGVFLGYLDLAYPERMIALEYDGGHHRSEDQYHHDIERLDRLMAAGWRIIRVNKALMSRPADLFAALRQALETH